MSLTLHPATTNVEIDQNVRVISRTVRGTQPLDRDLGIDGRYLDAAGTRGEALMAAALIDTLPDQEPRIEVKRVRFEGNRSSANYVPVVEYEVNS